MKIFLRNDFELKGYTVIKKFLNDDNFFKITKELNSEILFYISHVNLKNIGGAIIGNLNCYPGKYGKLILELLLKKGFNELIQNLTGKDLSNFKILTGGNLSLPYGYNQHFHTDGLFKDKMFVVNIATSEITDNNGPTEIASSTHKKYIPYWKFLLLKKNKSKLNLSPGDLVIRHHSLWHRGTRNESKEARFLMAFILLEKKKDIKKMDFENFNKIHIYNNFFGNNKLDRLKEYIYVKFSFLFAFYKLVRSFYNQN
jgi:hypothetical protein